MSLKTKYILDAIKHSGPNAPVKVVLNGAVTEVPARLALEQLHKPLKERRGTYRDIAPFEEVIESEQLTYENFMKEITASEPVVEVAEEATIHVPEVIEEPTEQVIEEEVVESKKKKKQTNE